MKHLKVFESFDSAEYTEVDIQTWQPFGVVTTWKGNEMNKVIEIMKTKRFAFVSGTVGVLGKEIINFENRTPSGITKLFIKALADEWFKVRVDKSVNITGDIWFDKQYYLCDQFDGLIKFIEEVL